MDRMPLEILEKRVKENPLMHRIEIELIISFKSMPSRKEIREAIAKLLNRNLDLIIIKKIKTNFGLNKARVFAFLYNELDWLKKFERLKKKDKEKEKEEKEENGKGEEGQESKKE